jgi:hypothetical protein
VFGMSPGGLTVGRAAESGAVPFVVVWNADATLAYMVGPFDEVDSAALNDAGDVVAAVRPRNTTSDEPRMIWIRDGKVIKSFEESFAPGMGVHVSAINSRGLVVGSAVPDHDERLVRAFSIQLPDDTVAFHDITGGNRVRGVDVNDAGAILLSDSERATQRSHVVEPSGSVRDLGIMTLSAINRSGVAVGWFYEPLVTIPVLYDTSSATPTFVSLTLPAGFTQGLATAINDAGLVVGYVWTTGHDFTGVVWQLIGHPLAGYPIVYGSNMLDDLAKGPFSIGISIDGAGRILTNLGGVDAPPALLAPHGDARAPVVGPLWELAVGEVNGQPVAGLKGVGVEVVLPNGQVITIPVIVLPPLGPGRGADPQKLWQLLHERDRARVVSSALMQIVGQLQDDSSKEILKRASAELVQHANRRSPNR